MLSEAKKIVSDYWAVDRKGPRPKSWLDHPVTLRNIYRRVSGDPAVSAVEWFRRKYMPETVDLALSLGCGFGGFERDALTMKIARRVHANDISVGAIERARTDAAKAGVARQIEYSVKDLNTDELPAGTYDVIFGLSAVHHVFQLEHLLKQCRAALKPGGLLFLDEYIGPSRFQSLPIVTRLINEIRSTLPERYRRNLFADDGSFVSTYTPMSAEWLEQTDPSEAVRSNEIIPVVQMYFDVLEVRPYGGALQHQLFSGIAGNFDENDERDVALLNCIDLMEQELESAGVLAPEFAAIVAKPK